MLRLTLPRCTGKPCPMRLNCSGVISMPAVSHQVALDAESAGLAFYDNVLQTTTDPGIKVLAREFVEEEA